MMPSARLVSVPLSMRGAMKFDRRVLDLSCAVWQMSPWRACVVVGPLELVPSELELEWGLERGLAPALAWVLQARQVPSRLGRGRFPRTRPVRCLLLSWCLR